MTSAIKKQSLSIQEKKNRLEEKRLNKKLAIKRIKRHYQIYLLLLPAIIYLILLKYAPMYGVQIAFRDFRAIDGIWESEWVGFEHFSEFFNNREFVRTLTNTIWISVYDTLINFPIPIMVALIMNQMVNKKYKTFVENVYYIPHFISTVVLIGLINTFFNYGDGFVNNIMVMLGGDRYDFIGSAEAFRLMFVFSSLWKSLGWGMIIYIAALAGIDPHLYEAATLDGATRWKKIINIDIPSVLPTVIIMFILHLQGVMDIGFEKAYLMQNDLNISTSEVIATYVYKVGLQMAQYDYAAAVGLFNSIINATLLLTFNALSKKITQIGLW